MQGLKVTGRRHGLTYSFDPKDRRQVANLVKEHALDFSTVFFASLSQDLNQVGVVS